MSRKVNFCTVKANLLKTGNIRIEKSSLVLPVFNYADI